MRSYKFLYYIATGFLVIVSFISGIVAGRKIERILEQSKACPVSFDEALKEAEEEADNSLPLYTDSFVIIKLKDGSFIIKKRRDKNGKIYR